MLEGIDENGVYKVNEDYYLYKLEEKNLFWVFNIVNGTSFKLNKVSYNILAAFDGEKKIFDIKKSILSRYDEDEATVSKDFDEFVKMCLQRGILQVYNK